MPEKRSLESHVSADLPIKRREEDRLNRSAFADALANVIQSWRGKPSLVVGLFGDWGSGKSSLKNLILESLDHERGDKLQVVEFSPWQVSGLELLSEMFFREIGKALGKTGPSDEKIVKRRVARWKMYSGILSIGATVARAYRSALPHTDHVSLGLTSTAVAVEGIAAVTKAGAEAVEAEGVVDSLTLSELKEQIREDLRTLDRPILVVLDDIDRLTKEEIRHTLQLVKANADFPNIIYLILAQKDSVIRALRDVAPDNPEAYLEKIIQVTFDVPVVNRKQLQGVLLEGLNELLNEPALEERFSAAYWSALSPHLFSLFRNLRDVNRFLGGLAFHIRLFRNGNTFEVNPIDLITLEAIRLFEPNLYKRMPQEKEVLTPLPRWTRDKREEEDKQRIEALISLASQENKDAIRNAIGELFPPTNLTKGLRFHGDDIESKWFRQLRVCSYQAFDRYFQLATPEGDVSQADIDELIANMRDVEALDRIFTRLVDRDLLDVMLARISSLKETLPLEHASTFLAALFQMKPKDRRYGFLDSSPKQQVVSITYWYLQRLTQEERLRVLEEALDQTRGIEYAIAAVGILAHPQEPQSRTLPFFEQEESRERLNQAAFAAIVRAMSADSGISPETVLPTMGFWSRFDQPAAAEWLAAYLQNRSAVLNFLESVITTSEGTGGSRRYIQIRSFEHTISIEELEGRVKQYMTGDLSAEEADLVRLFHAGVKRRTDGKEHQPLGMFDDDEDA
jgi:hypothetical protein